MPDFHFDKHVFRTDITPEHNEAADVGRVGLRWDTIRAREVIADVGTFLSGVGGSPGGANTQVQFNDGGVFGGDSGLTFNKTTDVLTVGGGLTLTAGQVLVPDGTAALPAYTFGSQGIGLWRAGSNKISVSLNGNDQFSFNIGGLRLISTDSIGWSSTGTSAGSADAFIFRDNAPNTLAQRNGTAAQRFNLYKTFTDASNYERLVLGANSENLGDSNANTHVIHTQGGGTGSHRELRIGTKGAAPIHFVTNNAFTWTIGTAGAPSSGHLTSVTDNSLDLGTPGANRPRSGYFGTSLSVGAIPASAGLVRLANAGWVAGRNAANSGDINAIRVNASDEIEHGATVNISTGNLRLSGGGYFEGIEIADPAAPAADSGRLYFRDNGSAKTQLVVRFPTGVVQVIATEP